MRVLILSSHFRPEPVIGALRPTALARHLAARGHEVVVFTKAGPWGTATDESYAVVQTPWLRLPVFRYVRGQQVTVSRPKPPTIGPSRNAARSPVRRVITKLAHEVLSFPDTEGGWIPFAYAQARKALTAGGTFDVIVSSAPSFASHIMAAQLSRRFDIPWVADYRDLWTSGTYYSFGRARRKVDQWVERRVLATASFATVTSEGLKRDLEAAFSIPTHVVMNGADEVELIPPVAREPLSSAKVNLLYVGNNFYGERRSPGPLFAAAKQLGLTEKDIRFHFLGSDPKTVESLATKEGVNDLVEVHPPVGHEESLEWQARADGLLLLLWNDAREHGTVPGKLFEYVSVRRPILLIGYVSGAAAQIVQDHELGWCATDAQQATHELQDMLSRKTSYVLLEDLPHRETLSREYQCERFESILAEAAGHRRHHEVPR